MSGAPGDDSAARMLATPAPCGPSAHALVAVDTNAITIARERSATTKRRAITEGDVCMSDSLMSKPDTSARAL